MTFGGGGSLRHCRGPPTRERPGKRINTRTGWMGIEMEYLGGWRVVAKRNQADVGHFSQNPNPIHSSVSMELSLKFCSTKTQKNPGKEGWIERD